MFQHSLSDEPFTKMRKKFGGRKKNHLWVFSFISNSLKVRIQTQHWVYGLHACENVDGPFSMKNSLENKTGIKLYAQQAGPMMSQPTDMSILSYVYLLKYK